MDPSNSHATWGAVPLSELEVSSMLYVFASMREERKKRQISSWSLPATTSLNAVVVFLLLLLGGAASESLSPRID